MTAIATRSDLSEALFGQCKSVRQVTVIDVAPGVIDVRVRLAWWAALTCGILQRIVLRVLVDLLAHRLPITVAVRRVEVRVLP